MPRGRQKGSKNRGTSSNGSYQGGAAVQPVNVAFETPEQDIYFVSLRVDKEITTASSDSLNDALGKLQPAHYKTKGVLTVTKGGKKHEQLLYPMQMRKFFNPYESTTRKILREQFAKNISRYFLA